MTLTNISQLSQKINIKPTTVVIIALTTAFQFTQKDPKNEKEMPQVSTETPIAWPWLFLLLPSCPCLALRRKKKQAWQTFSYCCSCSAHFPLNNLLHFRRFNATGERISSQPIPSALLLRCISISCPLPRDSWRFLPLLL